MPGLLKDKVAIITGAGGGIGRAHTMAIVAQGAKVVVNDLGTARDGTGADKSVADMVVGEIKKAGGQAVANRDSVATSEGAANIIKTAIDSFGRLDIVVNNAGVLRDRMVWNLTDDDWDMVLKTHLYGTFYMCREACKIFRQQRSGRIINTSSQIGLGGIGQTNYGAAKEGIVGLTRCVARDMGRFGVTCNAIRPLAATRMTISDDMKVAYAKRMGSDEGWEEYKKQRQIESPPEGNSPLVVFLASDAADNVNGCVFEVRKGFVGIYREPYIERSVIKVENWTPEELVELLPKSVTRDRVRELPPVMPVW